MIPSFVVIGTMKGGTTSLYRYLGMHPEVSMTSIKECDYFILRRKENYFKKGKYHKGVDWYHSLYREGAKAYGDISPAYTKRHLFGDDTPRLIHEANPDARLIYLLRDPIKRFLSQYVHAVWRGRIDCSVRELPEEISQRYLLTSSYHYQLEPYLRYFSLDQFLFLSSEEMRRDTKSALRRIFEFIGVPPYDSEDFETQYNTGATKTRASILEEKVQNNQARRVLRRLLPKRLTAPRPIVKPKFTDEERAWLEEQLAPDVARLRALTGMAFSEWSL